MDIENKELKQAVILQSILDEEIPTPQNTEIEPEEFIFLCDDASQQGFIRGASYARDGRKKALVVFLESASVTQRGKLYIEKVMWKYE